MNQHANKFLGEAPLGKLMLKFSIPCIMSFLINSIYNLADQIFIGHGVGFLGNGATTIVFPLTVIALAVALLIGNGCSAQFSLCQGRGEHEHARKVVGNSLVAIIVASVVLAAVYAVFMDPILKAFGATESNIGYARDYFKFIILGIPFSMFFSSHLNLIRADGSPRFAMIATLVGCVLNIILDALMVLVLGWGTKGAAIATATGQLVTCIMAAWYLFHTKSFKLDKNCFKINFKLLAKSISLGTSSFFTQVSIVLVTLTMNNVMVHYGAMSHYGEDIPIAAIGVVMKVFTLLSGFSMGLAVGIQPIVGYNYGAGNLRRVKSLYKKMMVTQFIIGIVATIIFECFTIKVVSLFGSGNELYNEFAVRTMRVYLCGVSLNCLYKGCISFMQGLGKPTLSMFVTFLKEILLHIPVILVMPMFLGINGVLLAMPISDIGAFIVTIILSLSVIRNLKPSKKFKD